MDYYIRIRDIQVPVSEEIYKVYCQGDRKERYFRESDRRNRTFYYDALDTEEMNGSEMFGDPEAESVEQQAEKHWFLERLRESLGDLSEGEKELLGRLYVYQESLRAVARRSGVPVTTLQARHQRLLQKLRRRLEEDGEVHSTRVHNTEAQKEYGKYSRDTQGPEQKK